MVDITVGEPFGAPAGGHLAAQQLSIVICIIQSQRPVESTTGVVSDAGNRPGVGVPNYSRAEWSRCAEALTMLTKEEPPA